MPRTNRMGHIGTILCYIKLLTVLSICSTDVAYVLQGRCETAQILSVLFLTPALQKPLLPFTGAPPAAVASVGGFRLRVR